MHQDKTSSKAAIVSAASCGGALEMYDFVSYGFFASIIAHEFFPAKTLAASLLITFAAFAIGYFPRPLGGILYGHFGDRYGRKKTLIFSVALMALPTFLIGLLPTYQQIGIWAPMLMVLLRLLQGLAVGGDLPGAITLVSESVLPSQRGYMCSWIFLGVNFGVVLSSVIATLLTLMLNHEQIAAWGWRIPFLLGIVLAIIGVYLRQRIKETSLYQAIQARGKILKTPFLCLLRDHGRKVVLAICLTCLGAIVVGQLFLYMPTYLASVLHYPLSNALFMNTCNVMLFSALIPVMGWVSDKIGRKKVMGMSSGILAIIGYPLFVLMNSGSLPLLIGALICFAILSAMAMGTIASMLAELFTTQVRYSGIGISYNIAFTVFSGLAPFLSILLIRQTHLNTAPSLYLIFAALVTFCGVLFINETQGGELK